MNHTAVAPRVIEYAGSDGQPMAETPVHRDVMIDAMQILTRHFAERSDVYVSGNMLIQGFGLHRGRYVPLEVRRLPNGVSALPSEALGLSLHVRGPALGLYDPATGKDLLTPEEAEEAEAAVRRAVEAENAKLRARIRELENSAHTPEPPRP
jgi:hypothetical protein